jgi:hypothetical protein
VEEEEEEEEKEEEEEEEEGEEEGEEEDTTELGEVQELGTEILEMILEQVFGAEDVEPQSSPGSTTAQLSQAPLEHVDVDKGTCEESGAEGHFSEYTQGKTHVPTIAEEPNLEMLGTQQQHWAQSPTLCPFDGPWEALFTQKQGMAITMMWRE